MPVQLEGQYVSMKYRKCVGCFGLLKFSRSPDQMICGPDPYNVISLKHADCAYHVSKSGRIQLRAVIGTKQHSCRH